jgi:hypothetical protein
MQISSRKSAADCTRAGVDRKHLALQLRPLLLSPEVDVWRTIMSGKRKHRAEEQPEEILMPMDGTEEQVVSTDDHNPRTNPAMRDGDSSHGNPSETAVDEPTTDNDAGDSQESEPPYSGPSGGAVGGTPAEKRSSGGHLRRRRREEQG